MMRERERILELLRLQREERIARMRSVEASEDREYENYYQRGAIDALHVLEDAIEGDAA